MMSAQKNKPVYVTQPLLPPLADFLPYLEQIWDNKILTNGGPFHQQLEQALCDYLGVEHICLFANGTLALVTALQSLRITGEVITTPYSFVATAHSLLWNGIKPVFVDIDPVHLNLDPSQDRGGHHAADHGHHAGPLLRPRPAMSKRSRKSPTTTTCKVIYDAAHAFGVRQQGGSVLQHGDLSVLSFHATKVFNTFEGGAIVCPDAKTKQRIDHLKNFGFVDEITVVAAGINGKMSEINAAFGLLQLQACRARHRAARRRSTRATGVAWPHLQGLRMHGATARGQRQPLLLPRARGRHGRPCRATPCTSAAGPGHPCAPLFLPLDLRFPDVPRHAVRGARQPARGAPGVVAGDLPAHLSGSGDGNRGRHYRHDRRPRTATRSDTEHRLMHISTETNFSGVAENHPWSAQFTVLGYDDGAISTLPHQFFRDWLDQEPTSGHFYIGRGSGFGVGSLVKYDSGQQSLCVGKIDGAGC